MAELYRALQAAILEPDPARKCERTQQLRTDWQRGRLARDADAPLLSIDDPGRPPQPALVDPRGLPRRSFASREGRICLLHAFAHIEFNAINIALDAAYRFRAQPERFVDDWLQVAAEEAEHFRMLDDELRRRGSFYGACDAHGGLWDMVCRTRHDLLHRMALVPRVMEARGLDVTPGMIERFRQFDDLAAAEILQVIYRDEVGHVRIGDHWYRRQCAARGVEPMQTFGELIEHYLNGELRGPFNWPARLEAGFLDVELEALENRGQPG
jgi:uncharacterized ferritin-like protein (DUF455 family)